MSGIHQETSERQEWVKSGIRFGVDSQQYEFPW